MENGIIWVGTNGQNGSHSFLSQTALILLPFCYVGSQEPCQEFLDAYRYQLATMAYGTAVAHYHHQPILRSVYKPLMRRLIHKMLLRAVWGYWFNTSVGGTIIPLAYLMPFS